MKIIRSQTATTTILSDLDLIIDNTSSFVLIEKGFETLANCINIIFEEYSIPLIKELLSKSGYYKTQKDHLIGKHDDDLELIRIDDIVYIEGINNDTFIHTINKEYSVKDKLYELESKLQDRLLVRISKSYIVSINHINKIKPTFNGKLLLILDNNISLEVSRHYITAFRQVLGM